MNDRIPPGEPEDPTPGGEPLTGTVLRGAGVAVLGYAGAQVITLAFYLALARLVTPSEFGDFAAASIVITAGILFVESGMLAALIQRRDRLEEAANTAVIATAAGGLLFSLIALALSPLIGSFFDSDRIAELSAALSGVLFIRSLQVVPEALLQRRFSFVRRTIVEPAQALAFGTAAVIATANDLGAWGLVIGLYASAVAEMLLSWPLARWRPRPRLATFAMWRELVRYGRHLVAANAIHRLGELVPRLLIGRFSGSAALGQFRIGERVGLTPIMLVISAASYVLFPALARVSHDEPRFGSAFLRSLRWFAIAAVPLGAILIPLGVPVAVIFFGEVWRDAGYVAMIMSAWVIASCLISIASEAFKAAGAPGAVARIHAVGALAGAAAMLAASGAGLYGITGGLSLGMSIGAVYGLWTLPPAVGVSRRQIWSALWPPLLAAAAMAAVVLPLEMFVFEAADRGTVAGLALIALEGAISLGIYGGVLTLLAPDSPRALRELVAVARRRGEGEPSAQPS